VRNNRGGSDDLADLVTGRFLHAPIVSSISFHREAGTNRYEKTIEIAQPRGPWRYAGRVAVLTNEDCASACEHFVSGIRASGEAILVGRPTTGACGWRKPIPLPG
jgi:C-terminal processing protease CtpA/Prc